jgi:hypothetical protein
VKFSLTYAARSKRIAASAYGAWNLQPRYSAETAPMGSRWG